MFFPLIFFRASEKKGVGGKRDTHVWGTYKLIASHTHSDQVEGRNLQPR